MQTDTEMRFTGDGVQVQPGCRVGVRWREDAEPTRFLGTANVRSGSIIYGDVVLGDDFQTGHHVLIREHTRIGAHVVIGTHTVIDGHVDIADFVKIESRCYIPTHTTIGTRVFFGPGAILTNDRYPLKMRDRYRPAGPTIEDGVTLGAAVVVLPGVVIGADSFVAAGAVVTRDIPPGSLAMGNPARCEPLPDRLRERNTALSWREYLA